LLRSVDTHRSPTNTRGEPPFALRSRPNFSTEIGNLFQVCIGRRQFFCLGLQVHDPPLVGRNAFISQIASSRSPGPPFISRLYFHLTMKDDTMQQVHGLDGTHDGFFQRNPCAIRPFTTCIPGPLGQRRYLNLCRSLPHRCFSLFIVPPGLHPAQDQAPAFLVRCMLDSTGPVFPYPAVNIGPLRPPLFPALNTSGFPPHRLPHPPRGSFTMLFFELLKSTVDFSASFLPLFFIPLPCFPFYGTYSSERSLQISCSS